jgi:hypothetical protein
VICAAVALLQILHPQAHSRRGCAGNGANLRENAWISRKVCHRRAYILAHVAIQRIKEVAFRTRRLVWFPCFVHVFAKSFKFSFKFCLGSVYLLYLQCCSTCTARHLSKVIDGASHSCNTLFRYVVKPFSDLFVSHMFVSTLFIDSAYVQWT